MCSLSCGGVGWPPTTTSTGSSGSGWRWTVRPPRRRSVAAIPARIRLIELKGGEAEPPHRGSRDPDRDSRRRRQPQRPPARPTDDRVDPDQAPHTDKEAPAGPLPRRRLRKQRDPPARARVRLHRAHPLPRRREKGARTRGRLPRPPLGRRTNPLLAQPLPRDPDPLVKETREPPRPAPPRLRPHHLEDRDRRPSR